MSAVYRYAPLLRLAVAWELIARFELVSTSALPPLTSVKAAIGQWGEYVKAAKIPQN